MTVTVRYYARLKQEAGVSQETIETTATTVADLWTELRGQHPFTLAPELIKAAQNDEFCAWDAPLLPGALVVYMPPVAGG